jgi:hypothetical protein
MYYNETLYALLPMDIQQHLTLSVDYVNNTL